MEVQQIRGKPTFHPVLMPYPSAECLRIELLVPTMQTRRVGNVFTDDSVFSGFTFVVAEFRGTYAAPIAAPFYWSVLRESFRSRSGTAAALP